MEVGGGWTVILPRVGGGRRDTLRPQEDSKCTGREYKRPHKRPGMETEEDFEDGWLPTPDLKIKVNHMNQIIYCFFEKLTASNLCLQSGTAMGQDSLVQSLVNDVKTGRSRAKTVVIGHIFHKRCRTQATAWRN